MSPCYRPGRWRVWHQKQAPGHRRHGERQDLRRGLRRATIEREQWMDAFMARAYAMAARTL